MNLQAMMNGMSAEWQKDRAATQMTLGKLIDKLESLPKESKLEGWGSPHSYRGYYSDLAFERIDENKTVGEFLKLCRKCMGEVFQGYKGGDFQMGRNTPVWFANYGSCGQKIMDIKSDGTFELAEDE